MSAQHVELSRVNKVVSIVHDIKASLRDYETKAQVFNKRERLFGSEESEYQALASIIKEFEPYASLWTTAADWQKWQARGRRPHPPQLRRIARASPVREPPRPTGWRRRERPVTSGVTHRAVAPFRPRSASGSTAPSTHSCQTRSRSPS